MALPTLFMPRIDVLYSAITADYVYVGVPIPHQLRNLTLQNLTNSEIEVSFDGVTSHLIYPPLSAVTYDLCANQLWNQTGLILPIGDKIYLRYYATSGAPTSGAFFISGFYGKGE